MADGLMVGLFLAIALAVLWFTIRLAEGALDDDYGRVVRAALPVYWHEQEAPSMYEGNLVHPVVFWFPEGGDSSTAAVSFHFFVPLSTSQGVVVRIGGGDMFPPRARQRTLEGAADYAARKFGAVATAVVEKRKRELAQAIADAPRREAERIAAEARAANERAEQKARWDREQAEREARWRAEQAAAEALKHKLSGPIALKLAEQQAAADALRKKLAGPIPVNISADGLVGSAGVVFGTEIESGADFIVPFERLQHMLIAGVSGSGKSVFMHQLLCQLVNAPQVEKMYLVDLKGGVEFNRYSGAKTRVIWRYADVVAVVDELVALMDARQDEMRERGLQNWPGDRTFLVIDEYAEIQSDLDAASTPDEKRVAKRLAGNLVRIARRARALGIVLVCALQKPTTDAMDSALRNNLGCRICLRVATRALAASMLDDLDEVPINPVRLRTGRYIYYDASRGVRRYVQAHVAPGIAL